MRVEQMDKPITQKKSRKKTVTLSQLDPDCIYAFKTIPVSQALIEKWIERLEAFPKDYPEDIFITRFYKNQGVQRHQYYRLLDRHPDLKEVHGEVMRELGERMYHQAVYKQADWKPIHFMLHSYSDTFKESYKFHASLATEEAAASNAGPKVIVIEKSPDCPDVKTRIKE